MGIYLTVFFILVVLSLCEYLTNYKVFFVIALVLLILFAGLREGVGYDYESYHNFFRDIFSFNDVFNGTIDAEPGYVLLNFIFKYLGFSFSSFILFFSTMSLILLGICLYSVFPNPSLALVYYYCRFFLVRDMGQIRSSFVAILLLLTLPAIKNRDTKKVLLLTFIGIFFHSVAIFIPVGYMFTLLLKDINIKVVFFLLFAGIMFGTIFFFPELISVVIPARYLGYFVGKYATGKWVLNPIFIMQMGILLISLVVVKVSRKRFAADLAVLLKIYLLSSILLIAFGPLATVGGRISTIFASTEIFLVPILFDHFFKNKIFFLISYFAFCSCIFYLIFVFSGAFGLYIPYRTVFF